MRLDLYMYTTGLAKSRTHASNLIKQGLVCVNGAIADKAHLELNGGELVEVEKNNDYASLGGLKLKKAIDAFSIDCRGKIAVDVGASNGGFTDVLLQNGAEKVFAVDVSECALPQELREDNRVVVKDKLNARYLSFSDIGVLADLITVDVSFISLKYILPALMGLLKPNGSIIALIKPQFELNKSALSKKGIVLSKKDEKRAVDGIIDFSEKLGLKNFGVTEAPHPFKNKNQEFLIFLKIQ